MALLLNSSSSCRRTGKEVCYLWKIEENNKVPSSSFKCHINLEIYCLVLNKTTDNINDLEGLASQNKSWGQAPREMSRLLNKLASSSPNSKVAASWALSATLCLTIYYFSRCWAHGQRPDQMKIRQDLNQEFSIENLRARIRANETPDSKRSDEHWSLTL